MLHLCMQTGRLLMQIHLQ